MKLGLIGAGRIGKFRGEIVTYNIPGGLQGRYDGRLSRTDGGAICATRPNHHPAAIINRCDISFISQVQKFANHVIFRDCILGNGTFL